MKHKRVEKSHMNMIVSNKKNNNIIRGSRFKKGTIRATTKSI